MTLLRWYNPWLVRLAVLAVGLAIGLATGNGIALADDDTGCC